MLALPPAALLRDAAAPRRAATHLLGPFFSASDELLESESESELDTVSSLSVSLSSSFPPQNLLLCGSKGGESVSARRCKHASRGRTHHGGKRLPATRAEAHEIGRVGPLARQKWALPMRALSAPRYAPPAAAAAAPRRVRGPSLARRAMASTASPPLPQLGEPLSGAAHESCAYLDYNATTPIYPQVAAAMAPFLFEHFGNPSCGHAFARPCKRAVEEARSHVAALLGCNGDEI